MKILYLHYCAIYPPQVVLQRDTKRCLLQVRLSATLHFSPHLQLHKDPKLPEKTTIWADVTFSRCHNANKFDFWAFEDLFLNSKSHPIFLSGVILHFIYTTPSRKRCQHQKRQTSNTILTQATSNEAQTVSGIKGPGRFPTKLS